MFVSIFSQSLTQSLNLDEKEKRIAAVREEECVWVMDLVIVAKSYSWVSNECPEMISQGYVLKSFLVDMKTTNHSRGADGFRCFLCQRKMFSRGKKFFLL